MTNSVSSADPQALFTYADRGAEINGRLAAEATMLEHALQRFAASCAGTPSAAGPGLAQELSSYAGRAVGMDERVRQVGVGFLLADLMAALPGYGLSTANSPTPNLTPHIPPESALDLALLLNDQKAQVGIVQTGPNEYLVLLKGTEWKGEHDWPSAIHQGLGLSGDYERHVREIIAKNIPAGATINFAGHSQGGMVANSLADNQDFLDRYHVTTVTTFGAATNARANPDVQYRRYVNGADPVPRLDRQSAFIGTDYGDEIHLDSGDNVKDAHPIASYVAALSKTEPQPLTPGFQPSQWRPVVTVDTPRGSDTSKGMMPAIGPLFGADLGFESTRTVATGLINQGVEETLESLPLPDSVERTVDRYRDRAIDDIMNLPTPSEAAEKAFSVGGKAAEKLADIATQSLDDLPEKIRVGGITLNDKG